MERDPHHGLVLQHGDAAPPAILGEWLEARGVPHEVHRTWTEPLPESPSGYGWIASLGSEHCPGAAGAPAWVAEEVSFLGAALELGRPVLGLCFGGQALAAAAGGSIVAAEPPEVGWFSIETDEPELVPPGPWLHHHYDQLIAPHEARAVARSRSGTAAFVLGPSLGLQFHPESTPAIAAAWAAMDGERIERIGVDPERVRRQGEAVAEGAREAALKLFDSWWRHAGFLPPTRMGTLSKG